MIYRGAGFVIESFGKAAHDAGMGEWVLVDNLRSRREVRARAVADPRVIDAERALRLNPNPEARDELDRIIADVRLEKQAELAAEFDGIHSRLSESQLLVHIFQKRKAGDIVPVRILRNGKEKALRLRIR